MVVTFILCWLLEKKCGQMAYNIVPQKLLYVLYFFYPIVNRFLFIFTHKICLRRDHFSDIPFENDVCVILDW